MRSNTSTTGPTSHVQAGFFEHLPRQPGLERLAELQSAAGKAPLSRQRLEPPLHQHDLPLLHDDRANAHNRLAGILPRRPRRIDGNDFLLGLKAQRMQHAALAADQAVLDPELVVAGARSAPRRFRTFRAARAIPRASRRFRRARSSARCAAPTARGRHAISRRTASRPRATSAPDIARRVLVIERRETRRGRRR